MFVGIVSEVLLAAFDLVEKTDRVAIISASIYYDT